MAAPIRLSCVLDPLGSAYFSGVLCAAAPVQAARPPHFGLAAVGLPVRRLPEPAHAGWGLTLALGEKALKNQNQNLILPPLS